jgi:outer membrane protein
LLSILFTIILLVTNPLFSQKVWNLARAVEYAIANNITVKQANISSLQARETFKLNKAGLYPTASFSNRWSMSFGRRQNPTTGILENTNALSSTFGFSGGVNLFNFYALHNTIAASKYQLAATEATEDKAKNDIAIRVANAYLLALQAKEQVKLSELQIKLTQEQLSMTRKRVEAGALPELNAAEIESQLAVDTSNLITSISNRELQLLQFKAILSLDAGVPFDIETPDLEKIPLEPLAEMEPELVYKVALANLPQQRINDFNIRAAEKNSLAARGAMYPSLSGFIGLSSNFFAPLESSIPGATPTGEQETGLFARNGTDILPVYSPTFTGRTVNKPFGQIWKGFGKQLNQQFGQFFGISLEVPLLNGRQARTQWERSRLNLKNVEFQKDLDNQTLKQDIYTAYNNAVAALQKHIASKKSVETAQRSYDLSKKRYDVNLLSSFELITNQNNLFTAQIDLLLARYDYVFKMKLLEFYKGQGLKL